MPASEPPPAESDDARRDASAQGLLDEQLGLALLRGMLDPVVAIDPLGRILMASDSVRTVFGYEPDELVGRNVKLLMPEPHHSQHDQYLLNYARTGETHILDRTREFEVVRRDGSRVPVDLSVARVERPDGAGPLFIGSFRDISDRKRARRAETSMLRALASLGRSAAVLAHEIKNPITSVNLALRAVADQLGEDQREVLEDLAGRMRKLELQMRQTLSYARDLDLKRTSCQVDELYADVARSIAPQLERDGVRLEVLVDPDVPAVSVDPLRLEEVLTNLLGNACEAMPAGGRVQLVARLERDSLLLAVEDDGPGVPPSVAESLFDPFVTTKQEGTGLGLSICQRVIEEHGGTLQLADAERLGGARFEIRLALEEEP